MTARITEQTATVRHEIVAPRIELFWDPATDDGKVVFHMQRVDSVDGVETARVDSGRMEHAFDTILGRTFDVPDGQGGSVPVPTMLVMGAIKAAFDTLYNEQIASEPSENPDPEPGQ